MPHIVVFGSTSGYRVRGKAYDSELCGRVGEVTGASRSAWSIGEPGPARHPGDAHRGRHAIHGRGESPDPAGLEAEGFIVSALHGMGLSSTKCGGHA